LIKKCYLKIFTQGIGLRSILIRYSLQNIDFIQLCKITYTVNPSITIQILCILSKCNLWIHHSDEWLVSMQYGDTCSLNNSNNSVPRDTNSHVNLKLNSIYIGLYSVCSQQSITKVDFSHFSYFSRSGSKMFKIFFCMAIIEPVVV